MNPFIEMSDEQIEKESDGMIAMLNIIIENTGDKMAILLKKSMQIEKSNRKIYNQLRTATSEKQELAINLYEQIDKLYKDFIEDLNIN